MKSVPPPPRLEVLWQGRPKRDSFLEHPVALYDASHGQPNWAQTGFTSRQLDTNFAGITELLCRLGFLCKSTRAEPLGAPIAGSQLLVVPPPTGSYDSRRQRWRRVRASQFTGTEQEQILRFVASGGRLLAFAYRFGDSFTGTNLHELFLPLGCHLNNDVVIDARALRQTHPLQMHFDTPRELIPPVWAQKGVTLVRWRPMATFTIENSAPVWPLALSPGGSCFTFDRTLRRISFEPLPIAVAGTYFKGRFALFGGPHAFETGPIGLLSTADNGRFLQNALRWQLADAPQDNGPSLQSGYSRRLGFGSDLTHVEYQGEGVPTIVFMERLLRRTGIWKALCRAKWMP